MLIDMMSPTGSKKSTKAPESQPAATFSDPLAKRKKPSGQRGTLWHPISEESSEEDSPSPSPSPKPSQTSDRAPASDGQPPSPRTLQAIQAAMMDSSSEEEDVTKRKDAPRSPWGDMSPRTLLAVQEAMQEEQETVSTLPHKPPTIDLTTSEELQHLGSEGSFKPSSLRVGKPHGGAVAHSSAAVYISSSDEEMDAGATELHVSNGNKNANSQQQGGVLSLKALCAIQRSSVLTENQTSSTDKEKMVGDKNLNNKNVQQGDSGIVEDSSKKVMSTSVVSSSTASDIRDTTITSSDSEPESSTPSTPQPSVSFLSERHEVISPTQTTSEEDPGKLMFLSEVPQGNGQEIKSEEEEEEGRPSQGDGDKIETSDESSTEGMAEFIILWAACVFFCFPHFSILLFLLLFLPLMRTFIFFLP